MNAASNVSDHLIADLARDGDDTALAERELAALIEGNEQLKVSKARLLGDFQPTPAGPPTHFQRTGIQFKTR